MTPAALRRSCERSLARLRTDYVDLYLLHWDVGLDEARRVLDVLEDLVTEGKIRAYGWSTDSIEGARVFAEGPRCCAIELRLNLVAGDRGLLELCERQGLAAICRSPLAMGMLAGTIDERSRFPADDIRSSWDLANGARAGELARARRALAVLREDGRTPAQGALAWLLATSPATIPIPGFRTAAQVRENVAAAERPLPAARLADLTRALAAPS